MSFDVIDIQPSNSREYLHIDKGNNIVTEDGTPGSIGYAVGDQIFSGNKVIGIIDQVNNTLWTMNNSYRYRHEDRGVSAGSGIFKNGDGNEGPGIFKEESAPNITVPSSSSYFSENRPKASADLAELIDKGGELAVEVTKVTASILYDIVRLLVTGKTEDKQEKSNNSASIVETMQSKSGDKQRNSKNFTNFDFDR